MQAASSGDFMRNWGAFDGEVIELLHKSYQVNIIDEEKLKILNF